MRKEITTMLLCCSTLCFSQQVTTKYKCHFLKENIDFETLENTPLSEVKQGTIPGGKTIDVIGYDTINFQLYKVRYKKKVGYISRGVVVDKSYLIMKDPKIRDEYKQYVINGDVVLGMTKRELTSSIGYPLDINRTVSASGVKEQYCYGTVNTRYYAVGFTLHSTSTTTNQKYIYLEDDIVTSYSD